MTESKAIAPAKGKSESAAPPVDVLEQQLLDVAKTPEERHRAYALASAARQADMVRRVATAMAEVGWGKDISPVARAATIRYCFEIGADPTRHVFVLGGNIFINGTFYREAVASEPDFLRADDPIWIHEDKRLSEEERARRRALRVEHNIPEESPAACIVVGHFKTRGPFKGIGRVRHGKTQGGKDKDPVGLEFPRESAETRAWRELGEKVVGPWMKSHPRLHAAQQVITEGRVLDDAPEVADLPHDEVAERHRLAARVQEQVGASSQSGIGTADGETGDRGHPSPGPGQPVRPKTVKHQPNAICAEEDYHPASECALEPR